MTTASEPQLERLQNFFASATHDASAAMSRWTKGLIALSLDEVCELPLEAACADLNLSDELLTMVVLTLDGDVGGTMVLAFDEENGRQLAAILVGAQRAPGGGWSELERSALCETGNILGCAYSNALARWIDCELVPSPPYFVQDFGASVVEQALMTQAAACDRALVCRTGFHRRGKNLNWNVFFIPTSALREAMERASEGEPRRD